MVGVELQWNVMITRVECVELALLVSVNPRLSPLGSD